jgi:hypothetical protein
MLKAIRLRDFLRARGCFFSVVGYDHRMGIKSFLRYVPSPAGDRDLNDSRYKKLLHEEAVSYALEKDLFYNPKLGVFLIQPKEIQAIYKPEEKILDLFKGKFFDVELQKVVEFFRGIPIEKMGVTGSRLIDLKGEESDIDFVMYGRYWFMGREKIRRGIERQKLSEPSQDTWDFIYRKRRVNIPYDIFLSHERRKFHRAVLNSTYFDLLYVRDYDELNRKIPEWRGVRMKKATIRAEVIDDLYAFDYPSYFPVKGDVHAILSFTHSFAGQALRGERVEARGWIEEIEGRRYLVVGTSREVSDEYIVSMDLLKRESLIKEYSSWKKKL